MPKNKVQFQKGISIHRFIEKYGTEIQCQKQLFNMRWLTAALTAVMINIASLNPERYTNAINVIFKLR